MVKENRKIIFVWDGPLVYSTRPAFKGDMGGTGAPRAIVSSIRDMIGQGYELALGYRPLPSGRKRKGKTYESAPVDKRRSEELLELLGDDLVLANLREE